MSRLTRRGAMLGALASGALGAGCGQGGGAAPGEAPPATVRPGRAISLWAGIGGPYLPVIDTWVKTFQERTGVKVEPTNIANLVEFDTKLATSMAGGAPPDVFRYRPDAVSIIKVVEQGWLLRLDELIKRDKYDVADIRRDALDLYRWKGGLHAIPRDFAQVMLFYNTDIFQREGIPPIPTDWTDRTWTYEKFLEVCLKVTRPDGERYAVLASRGGRPGSSFIYSNGGALMKKDKDGLATEIALAETPAVEALQFVQDLMYKHRVAPVPSEEAALGTALAAMQAGKLAMRISYPHTNREYLTTGMPYDVGVFPLGRAGRRAVGGGGTSWAVSKPTTSVDEAWAFTSYIAGREGVMVEVAGGHTAPARVSVITSKEYLDPAVPPRGKRGTFVDGQEYIVREPLHARWPDVEREVVTPLLNEKVWSNQSPPAQVMREIKEKGDAALRG